VWKIARKGDDNYADAGFIIEFSFFLMPHSMGFSEKTDDKKMSLSGLTG